MFQKRDCDFDPTTAYYQQADGPLERTNKSLEIASRFHLTANADIRWVDALLHIQFTLDISPNAFSKILPNGYITGMQSQEGWELITGRPAHNERPPIEGTDVKKWSESDSGSESDSQSKRNKGAQRTTSANLRSPTINDYGPPVLELPPLQAVAPTSADLRSLTTNDYGRLVPELPPPQTFVHTNANSCGLIINKDGRPSQGELISLARAYSARKATRPDSRKIRWPTKGTHQRHPSSDTAPPTGDLDASAIGRLPQGK
ncbi:hypothetical protein BDU57DRAFT_543618 [Ampelomyces quisqualis]|uniref:Uncharacterized protein n=1 Tax=Ampelomyces quisqualis TaxID=50730 RepID=A0A6A5Q9F6_AMPQU|nr:hypothetical protein BDU57DRAFT_543618 [Ampelomyces quisqualis]